MALDSRCLLLLSVLPLSPAVMAGDEAPDLALLEFLGSAEPVESTDSNTDKWIDPLQMFDTWQAKETEAASQRAKNTEVKHDD